MRALMYQLFCPLAPLCFMFVVKTLWHGAVFLFHMDIWIFGYLDIFIYIYRERERYMNTYRPFVAVSQLPVALRFPGKKTPLYIYIYTPDQPHSGLYITQTTAKCTSPLKEAVRVAVRKSGVQACWPPGPRQIPQAPANNLFASPSYGSIPVPKPWASQNKRFRF